MVAALTDRWNKLDYHKIQHDLWTTKARFAVVPAGRRSGKTELAKRKLIRDAINFYKASNGRFVFAAPTHAQAKEIFWEDAKSMVPTWALRGSRRTSISESERTIWLYNGAKIQVFGMDRPERVEGSPIDGIVLDEYGNMKAVVWTKHVRPSLSTLGRFGWCWFIGVPEGRNHYYELFCNAKNLSSKDWMSYTWKSKDIIPEEAEAAKADMDLLTYLQEYEGAFVTFEGRVYYAFGEENVTPKGEKLVYNPQAELIFVFDFNRRPGVAGVLQEQDSPTWLDKLNGSHVGEITAGIGEIFIENDSNTERVCDQLIERWAPIHKKGDVLIYGDASGGANTSQGVAGSDWDIVDAKLRPVFGDRLWNMYAKKNPLIRTRVNAVNTRFRAADGIIRGVLDAKACPYMIRDFEGVSCDDTGDIEKVQGSPLTHISDAWGYYMEEKHPCGGGEVTTRRDVA